MKHTSLLTDYFGRLYCPPAAHNQLKLFHSLIPGSEIITAVYGTEPSDIDNFYFRYQYVNSKSEFVEINEDLEFRELAIKTKKFLELWKEIIDKLNFIHSKEKSAFNFENQIDENLKEILIGCKNRCQYLIISGFEKNQFEETNFLVKRELLTNMML
jgi:hypothetical protein